MGQKRPSWALWRVLPRTRPYLRPYRRLVGGSIALTIASAILALAAPWPLALMLDTVAGERKQGLPLIGLSDPYAILAVAVAAGLTLTLVTQGAAVLHSYVDTKLEQGMILDLRSQLFDHAQRLSLGFHDGRRTGELMSRINYQASGLGSVLMSFPPLAQSLLTLIGMATVALFIDWQIALISLVAVPLIYYAVGLYGSRIVPRLQRVQSLEWESLSIVNEAMSMIRVVVAFGRESHSSRRFRRQGEVAVDERVKLTIRQTMFTLGVQTATAVGTALVFGFGFAAVLRGNITVGELVVLLYYVGAIYGPLEAISATVGSLHEHFVQLNASFQLLDEEPEIVEAPDAIELGRAAGAVTLREVEFTYPTRERTLTEISLAVDPGQRVAIVGPTGAGKTTLASLLVRFFDPVSGSIEIDGVDIRRVTLSSLRAQLAVVLQEPLLFSGTIAENIRYGKLDASVDEIEAAARAANAHEFVSALPDGYETVLGERGARLSGGERQRVCIARAFVKDAPILILDEPTSSIDVRTESIILDALDELMIGRTSFLIAHRLSTIHDADLIVVLDHGRIVQRGSHDELLEAKGLYRELYESQLRRRRPGAAVAAMTASGGAP